MTKKKLAIMEIIICICTLILLYCKHVFPLYTFMWILKNAGFLPGRQVGWVLIVASAFNVILLVVYCLRNFSILNKKGWIALPTLSAVAYLLFSMNYAANAAKHNHVRFGPLFLLELALLLLALGISCYRHFSNIPYAKTVIPHIKSVEESKINYFEAAVPSADELKKFKELLDQGVISQEEFDAKKKQLLGL